MELKEKLNCLEYCYEYLVKLEENDTLLEETFEFGSALSKIISEDNTFLDNIMGYLNSCSNNTKYLIKKNEGSL